MSVKKKFSLGEEIANSVLHGIGALLAIAAMVLLIIKGSSFGDPWHVVGFTIFGVTLTILYTMSAIYHAFPLGTTKSIFERFDHISIYLLIAGSYTPFCFTILLGKSGWIIFSIQWTLAIIGIVFKSIWIEKYVKRTTFIFVLMGWVIISVIGQIHASIPQAGFILLVAGGISYTIGTIFYIFPSF